MFVSGGVVLLFIEQGRTLCLDMMMEFEQEGAADFTIEVSRADH